MTDKNPNSFVLSSDGATQVTTVTGQADIIQELPREDMWGLLGDVAPSETGMLPPGVRSIRKGAGLTQLVIEMPPGVYLTCWGRSEGSGHAVYQLAMPWRYIVGVFNGDALMGARIFYSPRRVTHERQVLYHANVPNLNCRGYSHNVGVGWVCLYHQAFSARNAADMARYLIDRCSGGEPFNDNNMSSTDGPRFYHGMLTKAQLGDRSFLYDPKVWEAKTEAEGYEWTLEPDLWIPILVEGPDSQLAHKPDGMPLTLGMVMYGQSKFYYQDPYQPKVFDAMVRGHDWDVPTPIEALQAAPQWGSSKAGTELPALALWNSLISRFTKAKAKPRTYPEMNWSPLEEPPETFKSIEPDVSGYKVAHSINATSTQSSSSCDSCGDPGAEYDESNEVYYCTSCWPYTVCSDCGDNQYTDDMSSLATKYVETLEHFDETNLFCYSCHKKNMKLAQEILDEQEKKALEEEERVKAEKVKPVKKAAPTKKVAKKVAKKAPAKKSVAAKAVAK